MSFKGIILQLQQHVSLTAGSPRLQEGSATVPDYINIDGGSVRVELPITVYPALNTKRLMYFGVLSNSTSAQPARDALYTIDCPPIENTPLYRTQCILTIANATQDDRGFYNVTLANAVGQVSFRFQLDVNGSRKCFILSRFPVILCRPTSSLGTIYLLPRRKLAQLREVRMLLLVSLSPFCAAILSDII